MVKARFHIRYFSEDKIYAILLAAMLFNAKKPFTGKYDHTDNFSFTFP